MGRVFFTSADTWFGSFDFKDVIEWVRIDVSRVHFRDIRAVSALDRAVVKLRREGIDVEIVGSTRPAPRWWTGSRCTTTVEGTAMSGAHRHG